MNTEGRPLTFVRRLLPATVSPRCRACCLLIGIFCLASLLRVGLIVRYDSYIQPESFEFGVLADSLLQGRGLVGPAAWWFRDEPGPTAMTPPLYAYFLAGCLAVLPSASAYLWIELIQVAMSAVVILPVWFVARRIFGEPVAWLAAVLVALDYFLACTAGWINYPVLHVILLALVVWLGYLLVDEATLGRAVLFGAVAGLATLNKGLVAAYVVLLGAWIVMAGRSQRWPTRLRMLLVAAAVSLLVLAPWIVRNWRVFQSFVPAATNFGLTLWIGSNPEATGGLYAVDGRAVIEHVPESLRGQLRGHNEAEQSRLFVADACRWAREHPWRWMELRAKAFGYFWTEQNYWLPDAFYQANPGQSRPNPALIVLTFAMLAAMSLGLILTGGQWRELMPLYLLLLTYAMIYSLTHADITNRYRLPVEPWMLVLAAGGMMRCFTYVLRRGGIKKETAVGGRGDPVKA